MQQFLQQFLCLIGHLSPANGDVNCAALQVVGMKVYNSVTQPLDYAHAMLALGPQIGIFLVGILLAGVGLYLVTSI